MAFPTVPKYRELQRELNTNKKHGTAQAVSLPQLHENILDELSWRVKLKLLNDYAEPKSTEASRTVGVEALVLGGRQGLPEPPPTSAPQNDDESNMRMKLFRLMYETVRDSDLKVKRAELIKDHYHNSTAFEVGYLMGDLTDKFSIMSDTSLTLKRLYHDWKPIEHINAYEQIANQAIEISHLIDMMRHLSKRGILVTWGEQSYKAHDYMGNTDKEKLTKLALELLKDAKLKLRQVTAIMQEHGVAVSFEVGNIMGQIREKYKRMLEIYRDARDRYVNRSILQGPAIRTFRPMHYIISMELVHKREVEIDKLVGVLESIPKKMLENTDPLMQMKMKLNHSRLLRSGHEHEDLVKKEQELKQHNRDLYMMRKLGLSTTS